MLGEDLQRLSVLTNEALPYVTNPSANLLGRNDPQLPRLELLNQHRGARREPPRLKLTRNRDHVAIPNPADLDHLHPTSIHTDIPPRHSQAEDKAIADTPLPRHPLLVQSRDAAEGGLHVCFLAGGRGAVVRRRRRYPRGDERSAQPSPPLFDGAVRLRPCEERDIAPAFRAAQDPLIPRFTRVPEDQSEHELRRFVQAHKSERKAGRELCLAITDAESDAFLGAISLLRFESGERRGEIGYWVAPRARGRGVATRAVRLLSRWALTELGLARLALHANTNYT